MSCFSGLLRITLHMSPHFSDPSNLWWSKWPFPRYFFFQGVLPAVQTCGSVLTAHCPHLKCIIVTFAQGL